MLVLSFHEKVIILVDQFEVFEFVELSITADRLAVVFLGHCVEERVAVQKILVKP
jgi:hypothetical protein